MAVKVFLDEHLELLCDVTKVGRLSSKPQYCHLYYRFSCLRSFGSGSNNRLIYKDSFGISQHLSKVDTWRAHYADLS